MKTSAFFALAALSLLACGKGAPAKAPGVLPSVADTVGEWTSESGIRLRLADRVPDTGTMRADYHDSATDDPNGTWFTDEATRHLAVTLSLDRRVCGYWTDKATLRLTKVLAGSRQPCPTEANAYEYTLTKKPAATP